MSLPGLIWDAMLKMTKIKPEVIPESDMYIFFEKGTRGGISYNSNRYSKASNKYLKSHDPKQESKHIIYLDVNNFYGYGMSIANVKKLVPNFFDEEKYVLHYESLHIYFTSVLKFSQSQWSKPYIKFNTKKIRKAEKIITKMDGNALYKLMNNAMYEKKMEDLRNRFKTHKQRKILFKMDIKKKI